MIVHQPKVPFNEAKVYFDGKNHIYALKVEVGVLVNPSHYGIFIADCAVGSKHDYALHMTRSIQNVCKLVDQDC